MGITIREFELAMETYGVENLHSFPCSKTPYFNLRDIIFYHIGSDYVVQKNNKIPENIIKYAMSELREKYPGGKHFWYSEIHSIKALFTLLTILDDKYSKELVNDLTNETYQKLLNCLFLKSNVEFPVSNLRSPKMKELYKLLIEYGNIVNPFSNSKFKFKEPIQYLNVLDISLSLNEAPNNYSSLSLSNNSTQIKYIYNIYTWCYISTMAIQRSRNNGYLEIDFYYITKSVFGSADVVISLVYKVDKDKNSNINLSISLITGLAWQSCEDNQEIVTDAQIEFMISYLKISIKKIKNKIIRYMIIPT